MIMRQLFTKASNGLLHISIFNSKAIAISALVHIHLGGYCI